jgi:hypothetical protein
MQVAALSNQAILPKEKCLLSLGEEGCPKPIG